jgi:Cadherin domain
MSVSVVGNTNSDFAIDGTSGAVTVAQLLDYTTTNLYNLQFTANDGGQTSTLTVAIHIKTSKCYYYLIIDHTFNNNNWYKFKE